MNDMLPADAQLARETLGLTPEVLAADANVTPAVVAGWERGQIKVPRRIAAELRWRVARKERLDALAASGLATCSWIAAFEREPAPRRPEKQNENMERLLAHMRSCGVCTAREAFIEERFPPMPDPPVSGSLVLVVPIVRRVQALPRWAQPPAVGALVGLAYGLFRLVLIVPAIARAPAQGLLGALEGLSASALVGIVGGFLYGAYRRLRRPPVAADP